jgi:hypothetical protein
MKLQKTETGFRAVYPEVVPGHIATYPWEAICPGLIRENCIQLFESQPSGTQEIDVEIAARKYVDFKFCYELRLSEY